MWPERYPCVLPCTCCCACRPPLPPRSPGRASTPDPRRHCWPLRLVRYGSQGVQCNACAVLVLRLQIGLPRAVGQYDALGWYELMSAWACNLDVGGRCGVFHITTATETLAVPCNSPCATDGHSHSDPVVDTLHVLTAVNCCAELAAETTVEGGRGLLCFGGSCVRPLSSVQSHKVGAAPIRCWSAAPVNFLCKQQNRQTCQSPAHQYACVPMLTEPVPSSCCRRKDGPEP
jgi:hypothetical protein